MGVSSDEQHSSLALGSPIASISYWPEPSLRVSPAQHVSNA
jgi:hypothetical protein